MESYAKSIEIGSQYASIAGLILTSWTLQRVQKIRKLVARQTIHRGVFGLFDQILLFPDDKRSLTKTNAETVYQLVTYLEHFYISRLWWQHADAKALLKKVKAELGGQRLTANVKRDLQFLRDQLFSVENT